jgi:hypothetical protein
VYVREVEGQSLTLAVDGRLWRDTMLMYDQESGSRWSQFLGQATSGRWKGRRLETVPSVLTDWETWRHQHPGGTVVILDRTRRPFTREVFRQPGKFVLGIAAAGQAKAWSLADLERGPVRDDEWDGKPVLIVFDRRSGTARLYERTVNGRVLTLHRDGRNIVDRQTQSTWDPLTGRAVAGPLTGRYLVALPAVVSYRHIWDRFHPSS